MSEVFYVDHATTDEVKEKCKVWSGIDISKIVNVDYVWGEKNLKELTEDYSPFDYVIASHVIEHVPDLIGWFKEVRSVLVSGGVLSLAIPDKRFSFDCLRQLSKPGEVLEAYLLKSRRPSVKQMFDAKSEFVNRNEDYSWFFKEKLIHEHTLDEAWQITLDAFINNIYEDVHCWVFTESSFIELLKTIVHLNLFDFRIARFYKRTGHEFFVSLETLDPNLDSNERLKIQLDSINAVQKELGKPLNHPLFDLRSWGIINRFRFMTKKFL